MLSVIANFFNMRRQAPNTLFSLSREYQQNIRGLDYHVVAIDNGSSEPLSESDVRSFGPEFSYSFFPTQSPSPVEALNAACRIAPGEDLLILIDGAHILSPGILASAHRALRLFESPFVVTTCLHLGPDIQNTSVTQGYSPDLEEKLLQQCAWRTDGYNLFSIAGNFADNATGWFGCLHESNCFAIKKSAFLELGGFEPRFQSPGGGLANLDFFFRALGAHDTPDRPYIVLLGEATFHQVHGGISTNAPADRHPWDAFHEEFQCIRGRPYHRLLRRPIYLGAIPPQALHASRISAQFGIARWQKDSPT